MTLSHTCCSKFDLSWAFVCSVVVGFFFWFFFYSFSSGNRLLDKDNTTFAELPGGEATRCPTKLDRIKIVLWTFAAGLSFFFLTCVLRHESTSAHTDCTEEACGVSSLHFNNFIYSQKVGDIWLSNQIFIMQKSWTIAITGELHLNHLWWIIEFHLV